MIAAILALLGLCLGSFVNALVFRLHAQSEERIAASGGRLARTKLTAKNSQLSILNGRQDLQGFPLLQGEPL